MSFPTSLNLNQDGWVLRRSCNTRGTVWWERERTICFADDQGFGAANGHVSYAVSIRAIPEGKGPEELNCISSNHRPCIRWTPAPDQWLGLLDCGWGLPRPTQAHAACTVCGECGEAHSFGAWPPAVQGAGSTSELLAGIQQAAANPSVSLHWVRLVFLGLGGHTSRCCLCHKHRH